MVTEQLMGRRGMSVFRDGRRLFELLGVLLQLQCLRLLCAWRDRVAREQDESTK